jgi:asparaginyl-tRNA synthetase
LVADYWEIVGKSPSGDDAFNNKVTPDADPSYLLDNRHLVLRGETASAVLRARAEVIKSFRAFYDEKHFTEVTPPCMVQTQVEGGSTLFAFNYYGENVKTTYKRLDSPSKSLILNIHFLGLFDSILSTLPRNMSSFSW